MTLEEKIVKIRALKEDEFRENLLIPLFAKMGYIDPILHHHAGEKGKDIILKEYDQKFKKTYYLAAVVKAGDVTGSSSGSNSYFALLNQIRQCLNESYRHIYELREVNIDKVIVVISGRFLPTSLDSIHGTLKSEKLDRAVLDPIDINKLPSLIDEHFAEYWNEHNNEVQSLIGQRNFLLNNLSKLVNVLLPAAQHELFLGKAATAEINLNVAHYQSVAKYVATMGYHQLSIDEIDVFYADKQIKNEYNDIKEHFFEVKKRAAEVLYDIDEVVSILKGMVVATDPQKLVDLSYKLNDYVGGYGRHGFFFSTKEVEWQEEFDYALKEYRDKKSLLVSLNLYELYINCYDVLGKEMMAQLSTFFQESSRGETDQWVGVKITIDRAGRTFKLEHYRYSGQPEVIDKRKIIERERHGDDDIDIRYAIAHFGIWKEDYPYEKKARAFVRHFEQGFESMFMSMIGYAKE